MRRSTWLKLPYHGSKAATSSVRGTLVRPAIVVRFLGGRCRTVGVRGQRMDLQRLTEKSQEGLRNAQALATRRNHQGVDAEHLLAALLEDESGLAAKIVARAGADPKGLREAVERGLQKIPQVTGTGGGPDQVYVTQRLARLLDTVRGGGQVAQGRLRQRRAPAARDARRLGRGRHGSEGSRADARQDPAGAAERARQPARDQPEPGGDLRVPREVRPRPDQARRDAASSIR